MSTNNPRLKDYSDRELLELIISNQVNISQLIFRMNKYFISKYGKDYVKEIEHKEPTFRELLEDHEGLIRQIKEADNKN